MVRVLVVDDQPGRRDRWRAQLVELGYQVLIGRHGRETLRLVTREAVDLVMLEHEPPERDGIVVCVELRKRSNVPVVLMAEHPTPEQIVRGLESGADDFVNTKVVRQELAMRLQALLRRSQPWKQAIHQVGAVVLNEETREVSVDGQTVQLRPKEYELLHCLVQNHGQVVKKRTLKEVLGGHTHYSATAVEMTVRRLREKIEPDPSHPTRLLTERGVGYLLA